jgi:hypothetical protein
MKKHKGMNGMNPTVERTLLLVLFLVLAISSADAQRVTGQSASEALRMGDFQKAYDQYMILLESFPGDPLYRYGAGVSLVRMSVRPDEAADHIMKAMDGRSAVRSAPEDSRYYLARALHLSGRFAEAAAEYEKYASEAGRRVSKSLGIPDLILQCRDLAGQVVARELEPYRNETISRPVTVIADSPSVPAVSSGISGHITPPQPLMPSTDKILASALDMRFYADSLNRAAALLEGQLRAAGQPLRDTLRQSISRIKTAEASALRSSDSLMLLAGVPIQRVLQEPVAPEKDERLTDPVEIVPETVVTPTVTIKQSEQLQPATKQPPVTSLFAIKDAPFYSRSNQITVSNSFPPGLIYTIQLAVFRNPVEPAHFKRLYPVFGVKSAESELTYYYTGLFRKMADASKSLQSVKNEGFKDAFVVIIMDGKPVSAERGSVLAKDWETRELPAWKGVVPEVSAAPVATDTVPPTLLFRVEVLRSARDDDKKLNDEISRLAGDRGYEIMNPAAKIYVYIVGKFLNFENASAYADLLRRNGYRDARVVAYAGRREIPLETALKLYDRLN